MTKPKPKPIRLTKQRALALLHAAGRGTDEWQSDIEDNLQHAEKTHDLETVRYLKAQDLERAAALDAMAIVRHRYLGGEQPTEPNPTLF